MSIQKILTFIQIGILQSFLIFTACLAQSDSTEILQNEQALLQYKAILQGDSVFIGQLNDSTFVLNGIDTLRFLRIEKPEEEAPKTETAKTEEEANKNWKKKGSFNLNFSNVGLTNWAGGGQSAISLGAVLSLDAIRETDKSIWNNSLNTSFGVTKINGRSLRKSDDALRLLTQFSRKLNEHWSLSNRLEVNTQIWEGIKYTMNNATNEEEQERISNFLSPGRFEISAGLQYNIKGDELRLNGMISPLSGKLTVVLDDSVNVQSFGIEEGEKVLSEVGIQFTSGLSTKFMQNITFTNNLHLFANYLKIDNIDVNWETLLVLKVSKYINTNFSTNLIYDDDVNIQVTNENGEVVAEGPRTQFKHVLNVGMNFIF